MTITLYMPPAVGLFDSSGDPLSGGLVNTYVSGTTDAKNSYPTQDDAAAQTNANANPVVLNARGQAQIWLDGVYKIVVTDSAGSTIQTVDEYGLVTDADVFDKEYLQGLEVTLDTDTDHDVNVTAGEARDVSDSSDIILTGEITKRVDATWAVGDDNGGLDTGTVGATSIYYIWLIQRSDTDVEDVLISLSATAPTMPTSYDKKRLIGVGKTDGSSNWTFVSKAGWTDYHNCIFPDSATTDAYAVAPQPVHAQYFTGMRVRFRAATLNTAASTLNVNGLGAKALEYNGDAVVTGDIIANQIVEAEYDGTAFQMLTPPNILDVAQGGSGVASLTDGGVLFGSGTGDITAFGVLSDSNFLVGDGTTDPVAETGDTARISMGVGSTDSPTFTGLTTTGHTQRSLATSLTAGTTQTMAGALALTKDINIVTVVGSDDDGVALPTAVAGKEVTIINSDSAQRLQVWPGNGFSDSIDSGSANAVDANKLEAGSVRTYVADGSTNWVTSMIAVPAASATVAGIIELATDSEGITGTATDRAITPANLEAKVAGAAAKGIVELATDAETSSGTDTARAVTPANIQAMTSLSGAAWMLDEDDMATDSNIKVASQQSIKAYISESGIRPKNLVINGDFRLAQRGTSFATLTASQYTLDRHEWIDTGTTAGAVTITQATDVPTVAQAGVQFSSSIKFDCTTAEDLGSADAALYFSHKIIAKECVQFGHGASGAKSGVISFWIKSTKTGIITVNLDRNDGSEKYSFEVTISSSNTWELKTQVVPGDTSGTAVADDNGIGLTIQIMFAVGGNGDTSTADAWNARGATELATSNQVNLLDNTSNDGLLAGLDFYMGTAARTFVVPVLEEELLRSYHYHYRYTMDSVAHERVPEVWVKTYSTSAAHGPFPHPITMRGTPTVTSSAAATFNLSSGGNVNLTALTWTGQTEHVAIAEIGDSGSGFTTHQGNLQRDATDTCFIDFDEEL